MKQHNYSTFSTNPEPQLGEQTFTLILKFWSQKSIVMRGKDQTTLHGEVYNNLLCTKRKGFQNSAQHYADFR